MNQGICMAQRHEGGGDQNTGQAYQGCDPKYQRRRLAVHQTLAKQFKQIVVTLPNRRT